MDQGNSKSLRAWQEFCETLTPKEQKLTTTADKKLVGRATDGGLAG